MLPWVGPERIKKIRSLCIVLENKGLAGIFGSHLQDSLIIMNSIWWKWPYFIFFLQKLSIKTVEEVVSDFLNSRTHHKRDEDDHMPNYLNIKFGGFGEYLKYHFNAQIYKMINL